MNEPLVEKQESVFIQPEVESNEQSEQTVSFSSSEDLAKLETFSEPDTQVNETKRHRRKHSE
jgi:hypothetical protein